MKPFFTILLILNFGIIYTVLGQNELINSVTFSNELVDISSNIEDCVNPEKGTAKQYLNLRVSNKTTERLLVTFKKDLWYDGSCISCDSNSDEFVTRIELESSQSISGNCESDKQLRVFVKMLQLSGVRQLSHIEISNLSILKL